MKKKKKLVYSGCQHCNNKGFLWLLLVFFLLSGCLSQPEPQFNLNAGEKLDFNPLSFEVLKIWNRNNFTVQSVPLDACNTATRIDSYTWQVTLKNC